MDKIIPYLYKEYGQYVNSSRAFPLDIDGLKPVERRVLLSTFQIAKDKFVKSVRIDGYTVGNYHPHGSCYGTLVQLAHQGFLDPQGNFGCNVGVEPEPAAAPKYTECKLSKLILGLAFKYINYVEWKTNELSQREPVFLPTMFPLCLMGEEFTQGIGFGYRSFIPCYKLEDLYKRLLWLLGERKTTVTIKPITDCIITSTNADLEKLLNTGKATISVEGVIKENPRNNTVVLKSWPPGRKFKSLLNKFSKELDNQDIGWNDLSVTSTEIEFKVLKQRSRDEIFQRFVTKLKEAVKGSVSFEAIVVGINQEVKLMSIDNMLLTTFNMFSNVSEIMLRRELEKLKSQILEYQMLEKVRPYLRDVIGSKDHLEIAVKKISKLTKLPVEMIKGLISKYRISRLLTLDTDILELMGKSNEIQNTLSDVRKFVLKQYSEI